jgi:hypothetical protein
MFGTIGHVLNFVTYSCFSTCTLSKFVEVNEKLLNADPILSCKCLKFALDIKFNRKGGLRTLERTRVAMCTSAHVLSCVAERHLFLFNLTIFKYIR